MVGPKKKKAKREKGRKNQERTKKKNVRKKPRKWKNDWPSKLTARGQFHPIHEIPERDVLDGALVGVGSLKPLRTW
jgi:hypothetical protein